MSPRLRNLLGQLLRSVVLGAVLLGALRLFGASQHTVRGLAGGFAVIVACNLHHDWWIAGNSRSATAYRAWLQRRQARRAAR